MNRPILVTGAHRSGTTWIGKIISMSNDVFYIQEPFNIAIKKNNSPFKYWFTHLSNKNNKNEQLIALNYIKKFYSKSLLKVLSRLKKINSLKELYAILLNYYFRFTKRPLIKDPIAIMSAEWLNENINCDVIIVIRHPAAFIASLKLKNWQFDFNNFKNQHNLMQTYLIDFKTEISELAKNQHDIIDQGILLWNCIYNRVHLYQKSHNDSWYFITHETLSKNPVEEFEKIFNFLDLEFDGKVQKLIIDTTTSKNNSRLERNSKENILEWKNRLEEDEILRIKNGTKKVWQHFYQEKDW